MTRSMMPDNKTVPALNSVRNQNLRVRPRGETLLNPVGHLTDAGGIDLECGKSMKPTLAATPYVFPPNLDLGAQGNYLLDFEVQAMVGLSELNRNDAKSSAIST